MHFLTDPWTGTQERLDRRHRSELFVLFLCFWFLVTFGQTSQKQKNKKQQKVQTHGQIPRRGWTGDIGLNLFVFVCFWSLLGRPAKTKKIPKNKKFRPMDRYPGEAGQEA